MEHSAMRRIVILLTTCLVLLALARAGTAETRTMAPTQETTAPTSSSNRGAYDKLSPGHQKIAAALFDAQQTSITTNKLSLNDIAAMKQHRGWGEIFKQMKEQGLVQEKNLGQVISRANQKAHSGSARGTVITTASGRSQVVGKPQSSSSRNGHLDNDGAMDDRGANSGRGYGYGHADSSGSSAGMGRSGASNHGGGRGK
jgi:hypothetical protein